MPSNGYSTIGLKPAILAKLQRVTDEYYPGMFIPSTLIIMMNEIKRDDLISLTIRSDVKSWLQKN